MFTIEIVYGIIFIWKKIYLIEIKMLFHMVGDMCIPCSTTLSGVRNTEKKF